VARLLGQHGENDEPKVAGIERAAVARFVAAAPMAAKAPVAAEAVMDTASALLAAAIPSMFILVEVSEMHCFSF
jgi:hypothetical protein